MTPAQHKALLDDMQDEAYQAVWDVVCDYASLSSDAYIGDEATEELCDALRSFAEAALRKSQEAA